MFKMKFIDFFWNCLRLFVFLAFYTFSWNFIESSPIIKNRPDWNSIGNIRNLIKEQNDMLSMSSVEGASNYLVKFQGCFRKNGWETKVKYVFSLEGEDLVFDCGSCTPPSKKVFWRWITFEGVDSPLNKQKSEDDENSEAAEDDAFNPITYYLTEYQELVLTSPKPDLSSFYCYWEDNNVIDGDGSVTRVIYRIWTVEIVGVTHMGKVKARTLNKNKTSKLARKLKDSIELEVGGAGIRIGTEWSKWSPCSKCGGVAGKRYKTGFCSVDKIRTSKLTHELDLNLYELPISCSLLVDFHPEILSESNVLENFDKAMNLNHVLGRPHTILIGYCRSKRDCVSDGIRNKVISELYEDFEMKGDGDKASGSEDDGGSWSGRKVLWLLKSLVGGIPFGWSNLPEIVVLVGLVGIQAYVIYLVFKWRKEAN